MPLFAQGVLGGTAVDAGTILTPVLIGWPIASTISGRLLLRLAYRPLVLAGAALVLAACAALAGIDAETPRLWIAAIMLTIGLGMGFQSIPYFVGVQSAVPWTRRGVATSSTQFFRLIGGAVAVAALGMLMQVRLENAGVAEQVEALLAAGAAGGAGAAGPRRDERRAARRAAGDLPGDGGDRRAPARGGLHLPGRQRAVARPPRALSRRIRCPPHGAETVDRGARPGAARDHPRDRGAGAGERRRGGALHRLPPAHLGQPDDPGERRSVGEARPRALAARLVPEDDPLYTHTAEGPDDMPSHIRAALTSSSLSIPVLAGELALGTWQGIYLWEHRRRSGPRRLVVHVALKPGYG